MKKLILTCAVLASASIASFAQANASATPPQQGKPATANKPMMNTEQMADRRTKMDEKQLGLNPDQTKKAHDVELEFTQAMEKYRAAGQAPSPGQMGNLTSRRDQRMKEILTAEQYAKYEQINAKRNMAGNPNHPNNANANTPAAPAQTK